MENPKKILVPWDFSERSFFALQNAIEVSKATQYEIELLHIISKRSQEAVAKQKLEKVVSDASAKYNMKPGYLIKVGSIYETIKEVANDPDFGLAVMKTDGVKGIQKYTGSRAMKLIEGCKIPFIVVQQPMKKTHFEKILFPLDYRIENKQILSYITSFSRFYQFKLLLMKPQTNDKIFKKNITNTANLAKVLLETKNIPFEIVTAEGKGNYATQIIETAKTKQCDLIIIQLEKNLTFTKFLFGLKEQKILANDYKIPVMCLNPRLDLSKYGGFY